MPVKLGSKLPQESEARIEIIPLIDIMFFLLAAFMLVSLSLAPRKGVKVELPEASTAAQETRRGLVTVSVDKGGLLFLDDRPVGVNELSASLGQLRQTNPAAQVMISGDREARHGDVIRVLDVARAAGIDRVGFETRSVDGGAVEGRR